MVHIRGVVLQDHALFLREAISCGYVYLVKLLYILEKVIIYWAMFGSYLKFMRCEQYPNNTLLFVVLDKLYCNLHVTCNLVGLAHLLLNQVTTKFSCGLRDTPICFKQGRGWGCHLLMSQ